MRYNQAHVSQLAEEPDSKPGKCAFESHRGHSVCSWLIDLVVVLAVAAALWLAMVTIPPTADAAGWDSATATWYGPGFYGNTTACGHRYSIRHRGVAVPSGGRYHLRCGTRLTICRRGTCVRVRVTDTGGFRNHRFDLSARTAMDLCGCWKPYTMRVRWRRGWVAA